MSDHDSGDVPDLTPTIHPRLEYLIAQVDRYRVALALQRQIPKHDADVRMRLAELERMGCWFPTLIPERGRRAIETALMATMMYLRRHGGNAAEVAIVLPGIVIGGRAAAESYERASHPGVLTALNTLEQCFEESRGELFQSSTDGELRDAALQLVAALRMQDGPTSGPPAAGASAGA